MTDTHQAIREALKALPLSATPDDMTAAVLAVVAPMQHAYKIEREGDQIVVTFANPRDADRLRGVLINATVRP